MARLIDANVLANWIDGSQRLDTEHDYEEVARYIEECPTVDAAEVCRCKDCRYSREPNRYDRDENAACEGVLICCVGFDHVYPSSDDGLLFVDKNGYCCHGERKGGDE